MTASDEQQHILIELNIFFLNFLQTTQSVVQSRYNYARVAQCYGPTFSHFSIVLARLLTAKGETKQKVSSENILVQRQVPVRRVVWGAGGA